MGGWNILDDEPTYLARPDTAMCFMDRSYRPEEIAKDFDKEKSVDIDKLLGIAEDRWKIRQPLLDSISIAHNGMSGTSEDMSANGWKFEVLTNKFNNVTRLYAYHPHEYLLARGDYSLGSLVVKLDFMVHQKEFLRRYRGAAKTNKFLGGEVVTNTMTNEEILLAVAEQIKATTPKRKKKVKPSNNVINISGLLEEIKEREAQELLANLG